MEPNGDRIARDWGRGRNSIPTDLLDFVGVWTISRKINDFAGGAMGRFAGQAQIAPSDDPAWPGLTYHESGLLTLGRQAPLKAQRRYLWQQLAPGVIEIRFQDGRPFHHLTLAPRAADRHHCAPDLYAVRYALSAWPRWSVSWRVTGPRKNYRMTSLYRPA